MNMWLKAATITITATQPLMLTDSMLYYIDVANATPIESTFTFYEATNNTAVGTLSASIAAVIKLLFPNLPQGRYWFRLSSDYDNTVTSSITVSGTAHQIYHLRVETPIGNESNLAVEKSLIDDLNAD
jgi:hypothetical protein